MLAGIQQRWRLNPRSILSPRRSALGKHCDDALEEYVCKLYQLVTDIVGLPELRWWMFRRKQAELLKLPPLRATFLESVKRVQYQCIVWKYTPDPYPDIPMPDNYGWKRDCDE